MAAEKPDLASKLKDLSKFKGEFYLVDEEGVQSLYKMAGIDLDDEDAPIPTVIEGKDCEVLFTERNLVKDDVNYELVLITRDFTWGDFEDSDDEASLFEDEE